jgi:hypothetical protein
MSSPKKPLRVGIAGATVLALLAVPTLTYAFDKRIANDVQHFIDCAQWIWHDTAKWKANCQPSRPVTPMEGPSPNQTFWAPPSSTVTSSSVPVVVISSSSSSAPSDPCSGSSPPLSCLSSNR